MGSRPNQLITLVVPSLRSQLDADLVWPLLGLVDGIDAVEPDIATGLVWVFGNGAVEPESLVETLALWGLGAQIVESHLALPS